MKHATFYLMESNLHNKALSAIETLVCYLAATHWRAGKSILIACETEQQAIRLDEALWQNPANSFIPHNLAGEGEGPRYGAPVELSWLQYRSNLPRDLLINLLLYFTNFSTDFNEVIDFVPYKECQKQLARDRYKAYRSVGFQLNMAKPPQTM
ncbi:DNA polymerase III subunit chi [Pantoea sp. Nvir]|uniref:DNA polymerase III subunit chi n=1 Tax=Pantoea sp. Nvir TaxID=2576760 RepID=UPI0013596E33|nr:DNA polymerase III subunit chi [Pantoea sp. Nvir]MXP66417.1 DNA polymerase III subunit chi [Pantoea sp. Nvir]CAJ0993245.1 DNA polymerase III subunit chi [Pantoea sp. Nvir]